MSDALLTLRGIDEHFGPGEALYRVDLDLPAGAVDRGAS